jgi:excisionase family DNA binding protein
MKPEYLATGEVARRCGVTRDTVVKWIKAGRVAAKQTPGGHHRVLKEDCEVLVQETFSVSPKPVVAPSGRGAEPGSVRCWEYFSEDGATREVCKSCLVYLARAQRCYRLAELGEESGHRLHFCRNDCRTCAYYRACQGLATEVLVVTTDEALTHRLLMKADPEAVSMRFARSGYEGSATISSFSPALIVIDSGLPEMKVGTLVDSLLDDERIPGSRIAVAVREGDPHPQRDGIKLLRAPFTAEKIERLAKEASRAMARAPKDIA